MFNDDIKNKKTNHKLSLMDYEDNWKKRAEDRKELFPHLKGKTMSKEVVSFLNDISTPEGLLYRRIINVEEYKELKKKLEVSQKLKQRKL